MDNPTLLTDLSARDLHKYAEKHLPGAIPDPMAWWAKHPEGEPA